MVDGKKGGFEIGFEFRFGSWVWKLGSEVEF